MALFLPMFRELAEIRYQWEDACSRLERGTYESMGS
jgi:hypothetical protein